MRDYFVWLAKLITIFLLIFVVFPIAMGVVIAASKGVSHEGAENDKNSVAVIELRGMIENEKEIVAELYKQASNDKVKGIVLRIDSPGGAVAPSQDIYSAVKKLKAKKPIVASMGSLAASGGFYSALGASKIFCQPGTMTGSVGVILQIPNLSRIANWVGVDMVTIKSGKMKDVGNTFRDMTPEERAFLETTASTVHEEFLKAVSESRNIPLEKVREFGDGRVILGSQAKELNLVDEFGDVYDAARAVFDLLGQPLGKDENPSLYYPGEKFAELRKILEAATSLPSFFLRQPSLRYEML